MFVSFFPRPLVFILSAILWGILAVGLWYAFGTQLGALFGFQFPVSGEKIVGAAIFWSAQSLWFYLYFAAATALFASAWMLFSHHRWSSWSILGSRNVAMAVQSRHMQKHREARRLLDEPVGKRLGQRRYGDLLLLAQNRKDRAQGLPNTRRREGGRLRLHREILQHSPQTLDHRLSQPC